MELVAVITRADFETALAAARRVGSSASGDGLEATLDGALLGRISDVWDHVETALSRAFQFGADRAKEYTEAAIKAANDLIDSAGKGARAVQQELLKRAQVYLSQLVDAALAQIRPTVTVGAQALALESVEMEYKISLGGSLSVTITDLVRLTSSGEITISADYRAPNNS